jgi:hypothetical protein
MEDDRVEKTESWSSHDRRRFWIAVVLTVVLGIAAFYGFWLWLFTSLRITPPG